MAIIFHITTQDEYQKAQKTGAYTHKTLQTEGFIHCSQHYQLIEVAEALFINQSYLILLAIDEKKCRPELRYEGPSWNSFPHIYGKLNLDAIVQTFEFKQVSGKFVFPAAALELAVDHLSKNSMNTLYRDAKHYDAMNESSKKDIQFFNSHAAILQGEILDLACGTGRFSIPLAQTGHKVTGLDLSSSMLALAKKKAAEAKVNIQFHLGDMRMFNLNKEFQMIFCGFNSSQHLLEEKEMRSFLECTRNHLKPDGVFILDVFNPSVAMLNRSPKEKCFVSTYADPDDQQPVEVYEYPEYDSSRQVSHFRYLFLKNGQLLFEEQFSLRMYFPQELDVLLRNSGFKIMKKLGGYDESPFARTSMKQILFCQKS